MRPIKIFGKHLIDPAAIRQLENCMLEDSIGVLTADAHKGYHHPIGGAIAYKDHISVSGVGYDIGCGNMAVKTDIGYDTIRSSLSRIMDRIFLEISFGMGISNDEPVEHAIIDEIARAEFAPQRTLVGLAQRQLGTVGGGNHFVDLFRDSNQHVWIGVHFGSRGFGHKTASGFIAMSQGLKFTDRGKDGSMDDAPILLRTDSELGSSYLQAMMLAGRYAEAGRQAVVSKVLQILGNPTILETIHNHHNFAWRESHFGEHYWVVRKGCTPAWPGQESFVGADMLNSSATVRGLAGAESAQGLYTTVHGAGRLMSRTQAAGKKKWVRGSDGVKRSRMISGGVVNFLDTQLRLDRAKIELRGGGPDESYECYKSLQNVLAAQGQTIDMRHALVPIGVAMAPSDMYDPYKD